MIYRLACCSTVSSISLTNRCLVRGSREGNWTPITYDAVGNLTQVTGADGEFVTMSYDLAGRKTAIRKVMKEKL